LESLLASCTLGSECISCRTQPSSPGQDCITVMVAYNEAPAALERLRNEGAVSIDFTYILILTVVIREV